MRIHDPGPRLAMIEIGVSTGYGLEFSTTKGSQKERDMVYDGNELDWNKNSSQILIISSMAKDLA